MVEKKDMRTTSKQLGLDCFLAPIDVAEHFNSGTHKESDMAVMAIEFARSCDICLRKIKESMWIRTLGTLFPLGMNLRIDGL